MKGRALPDWYLQQPDIDIDTDFYLKAFYELSTCRPMGMGMGAIPWDKARLYAEHVQLQVGMIDHFISIIRIMDDTFLKWHLKSSENKKAPDVSTSPQKNQARLRA